MAAGNIQEVLADLSLENKDGVDNSEYVKLKVMGNGNEIHYRVKLTTQMEKLKKSYAKRIGIPIEFLRFLFNGWRINDDDTPRKLGMKTDDVIVVYQDATYGH